MAAGDGGITGNGCKVGYQTVASPLGSWTSLGQIQNIEGLEVTVEKWDATVHSANRFAREGPGLIVVSPLVITFLANPNPGTGYGVTQENLYDLLIDGQTLAFRLEKPTNRQQTLFVGREFEGFVSAHREGQPIRDAQTTIVEITFDATTIVRDQAAGASEIT